MRATEGRKQFFFEKKNQKTFECAVADLSGKSATAEIKAFCFFFSKKKAFLSHATSGAGGRERAKAISPAPARIIGNDKSCPMVAPLHR